MNKNKGRWLYISLALTLAVLASFVLACDPDTPPPPTQYKVTFDTDKGSAAPAEQTVVSGTQATEPADNPTKTGFGFGGWYKVTSVGEAVGATPYDFSAKVTGNIILKAKWDAVTYTATFELDGGTAPTTGSLATSLVQSVAYSPTAHFTAPGTDPTKVVSGATYTFDGWYKVGDAGEVVGATPYDFSAKVTGNIILKAKWLKFTLSSSASDDGFDPGSRMPVEFGYIIQPNLGLLGGKGSFPKLSWSNVPKGTNYFVLLIQNQNKIAQSHGIFLMNGDRRSIPKALGNSSLSSLDTAGIAAAAADPMSSESIGTTLEKYLPLAPPAGGGSVGPQTWTFIFKIYAVDLTRATRPIADLAALRTDLEAQFTSGAVGNFLDKNGDYAADGSTNRLSDLEVYLNDLGIVLDSASITGSYNGT